MKPKLLLAFKSDLVVSFKHASLRLWVSMFFWFAIGLTAAIVAKPNMTSLGSLMFDKESSAPAYLHRANTPIRVLSRDGALHKGASLSG